MIGLGLVNKRNAKKVMIFSLAVAAGMAFWSLGLHRYLELAYLKESLIRFKQMQAANPGIFMLGYGVFYILLATFSLPGAGILTVAGGAMFGLGKGFLLVSFASTIGATLACFFARFVLRDWVQNRFSGRMRVINRGIEAEGAFYLFSLRLVPIFPFFIINLAAGLTKMPLFTFYWVSQLGMLPSTLVFVNAGQELSKIDSLASVFSPGLIISFVLLGLFPLAAKKGLTWYRLRSNRTV